MLVHRDFVLLNTILRPMQGSQSSLLEDERPREEHQDVPDHGGRERAGAEATLDLLVASAAT